MAIIVRLDVLMAERLSLIHILLDLTFLQGFERIRELYGVLPSFLEFELAEAFVFEEPRAFFAAVDRLHRAGYARCV